MTTALQRRQACDTSTIRADRIAEDSGDARKASGWRRTDRRPLRLRQYAESEYAHQCTLVECLRKWCAPDVLWFAIPNQQNGGPERGAAFKRMGVRAGASDLVFLYPSVRGIPAEVVGQVLLLELKTATGQQSPTQMLFAQQARAAGAEYVISRSLIESLQLLWARGILTKDLTKQS